jgi:hypothetical protein
MREVGMPKHPITAAVALVALSTALSGNVHAQGAVSFKDSKITMLVEASAGGGTDAVGRTIARYIGKFLPGEPAFVVQNMPGANGITAMNYFVHRTEPNGLTVMMGSSTTIDPLNFRSPGAQYDPRTFRMVGGVGRGGTLMFTTKDGAARLLDKTASPVIIGNVGPVPRQAMMPALWGIEYLGWNAKWVVGYTATSELILAFDRGEIELTATGILDQITDRLKSGGLVPLYQSGSVENGKIVGHPAFGDTPIFPVQMKDKDLPPLSRKALDYWFASSNLDKWLGLAAKTPDNILAVYREAFTKLSSDKEFIRQGRAVTGEFIPASAADVEEFVRTVANTTPETLEYVKSLIRKQGMRVK